MGDSRVAQSPGEGVPQAVVCPDENEIAALVEGKLPPADLRRVEEHLRRCEDCGALFAELGHVLAPGDAPAGAPGGAVDPLQRYQIVDTIGAGGMGVVHLAFDRQLRRKVALKVIRPELADTNEARQVRQRLVREARSLAALSHPNVVTVYDVGTLDDQVFIAVEYVEGRNVSEWLAETRPDWRQVLEVFLQAGQGLAAAHAAGLVHRDVKPDNLLVGSDGRVRVTDFGLATSAAGVPPTALNLGEAVQRATAASPGAAGAAVGIATAPTVAAAPPAGVDPAAMTVPQAPTWSPGGLTTRGAVVGTPAYMAPEQLAGERADARSDQFSFCVSLYEALYGPRPFQGATFGALLEQIRAGNVVRPSEPLRDQIPTAALEALTAGLRFDPATRWPAMEELLAALASVLAPAPASVEPPRGRSGLWPVLAVVGIVATLVLAAVVAVILATSTSTSTGSASASGPGMGPGDATAKKKPLTARQLLLKFLDPGADHRALTQTLKPRPEDCRAYFVDNLADQACAHYARLFGSWRGGLRPGHGQSQLLLRSATVEELRNNSGAASYFPGGYRRMAASLRPGHRVYRFKFVQVGKRSGMAYDGLVHLNGRWVFFPKPWRILQGK